MQIVIDIPDTVWDKAKEYGHLDICGIELSKKVMNGIPLPKKHGRLGDLDKIYVELNETQIEGTEEYKGLGEAKQIVCDAKSIIEADKEESEDKE